MKDPIIKPQYLARFVSGFPNSKVVALGNCGHFPQEEQHETVVAAMKSFLDGP